MASLTKFGFRIRTRHGLVVENLTIQARDESDAERKLRQMYRHCEVLHCAPALPFAPGLAFSQEVRRTEQMTFEDVMSFLSK